jgi:hypothetical protein
MPTLDLDLEFRKQIARELLSFGISPIDGLNEVPNELLLSEIRAAAKLNTPFPEGFAPIPAPIVPKPNIGDTLPKADVVVVTWTIAEQNALADIFTPGYSRVTWYRYNRHFEEKYASRIRKGAPASDSRRLGSYFESHVKKTKVLCFKSELHLNQDGIQDHQGSGQTSLPVRDLFKQIIEETGCAYLFTTGTCGGIQIEHDLGDVLVTRAAKFRCSKEFSEAPFNRKSYKSEWEIPSTHFGTAEALMQAYATFLNEPEFGPPTKRHSGSSWTLQRPYTPGIIHEQGKGAYKLPTFHPILTTDYFEFGHSNNAATLWEDGCGVEMGDAVLGLVCEEDVENPPKWLVIRNLSDPQINGDLPDSPRNLNMQIHWAVWYYETYGYWTSVMSALTTWAVIAGL